MLFLVSKKFLKYFIQIENLTHFQERLIVYVEYFIKYVETVEEHNLDS